MRIHADLHTHTIASTHAYSTISENATAAAKSGIKAIAMTDHAPMMEDAPHIWHFDNMGVIPREINGVTIIRGSEVNIMDYNGNIDMSGYSLRSLEWVVASLHGQCCIPGTIEENTQAYIKACKNQYIDVFGHPTTNEFLWDYEKGLKAVKEYGKFIEINECSIRTRRGALENAEVMLKFCKELEISVVINTDAHFCQQVGITPVAEKLIEEIQFPHNLIVNLEWERVKSHILKKHPTALQ